MDRPCVKHVACAKNPLFAWQDPQGCRFVCFCACLLLGEHFLFFVPEPTEYTNINELVLFVLFGLFASRKVI